MKRPCCRVTRYKGVMKSRGCIHRSLNEVTLKQRIIVTHSNSPAASVLRTSVTPSFRGALSASVLARRKKKMAYSETSAPRKAATAFARLPIPMPQAVMRPTEWAILNLPESVMALCM